MGKPRLLQGPPKPRVLIEVKFSPRELEFINLRYQKELSQKEVAAAMGITVRMVRRFNERAIWKMGIAGSYGCQASGVKLLKLLIRYGFVTMEDA